MTPTKIAPYGTWQSPITADFIVSDTVGFEMVTADGDNIYWIETRPKEGGRHVIVRRSSNGTITDMTPPTFYAATRVHEYGGGSYATRDGIVYFSNYSDQRVYRYEEGYKPTPITPEPSRQAGLRFADMIVDKPRQRLIAVLEDHTGQQIQPVNKIVAITYDGKSPLQTLAAGHDFYSSPRLSKDGSKLAWLSWDHPNMPWDGSELNVGSFNSADALSDIKVIAGGASTSIFQPEWSMTDQLLFVSDQSNWWNLYCYEDGRTTCICPMDAEFGRAQWQFGFRTYVLDSPHTVICTFNRNAIWKLARIDLKTQAFTEIETEYTDILWPTIADGKIVFRGASSRKPWTIVAIDLATGRHEELKICRSSQLDDDLISTPQILEFPTTNGLTAHGFYYPPNSPDYVAPPGRLPPLIVRSHGGPTSSLSPALNLEFQYWTSRGFAVVDVNYGGSTSYGRKYRERLHGQWGIVDVDDCVNAAWYLVSKGLADLRRLLIVGRSASGFTTLCALAFKDVFRAGASYYGIGDLIALMAQTHKFELHSLDKLIGPYPEQQDKYLARSPLYHTEGLNCPVIFFQGLEDKVVPPNQTRSMVEALEAKHLPVACLMFDGERHGFRKAETIKRALECELYFYSRVLGFEPADKVEPLPIENLGTLTTRQ